MSLVVACDIGLKRIGLAQYAAGIIVPLDPILRNNRNQAAKDLSALLLQKNAEVVVFGIPLGGSSSQEMARRIKHFAGLIEFEGERVFVDESFSSFEAKELLKGIVKDKKDGKSDSLSACIILERYLAQRASKQS